jgi:hypothetical protein
LRYGALGEMPRDKSTPHVASTQAEDASASFSLEYVNSTKA